MKPSYLGNVFDIVIEYLRPDICRIKKYLYYEEKPSILSSFAKRPTATIPQNPPKDQGLKFQTPLTSHRSHGHMLLRPHRPPESYSCCWLFRIWIWIKATLSQTRSGAVIFAMKDPTIPGRSFILLPDNWHWWKALHFQQHNYLWYWPPSSSFRGSFQKYMTFYLFTHESLIITYEKGLPDIDHSATGSHGNKTAQYPVYL